MNIKSLLIGSAAALAAVSGAQAADAIVAAEPEPMEYVRVCDAYGTGFFYIPGTETCLRISGEVRATLSAGDRYDNGDDWISAVRTRVNFEAKNDSELGTITSFIRFEGTNGGSVGVQQSWIGIGGFKVGRAATFWDDLGTTGETDAFADQSVFNTISYTYDGGAFKAGFGVDDLSASYPGNEVGLEAFVSGSLGAATVSVWGVYDWGAEEGAVYGLVAADLGPGKFELSGAYSSGANVYVDGLRFGGSSAVGSSIEWTVAAAYTFAATEKLSITPNVSYWEAQNGRDAWGAGLFAEYKLAEGLKASATVDYYNTEDAAGGDDWSGFLRLTRSF